MGPLLWLWVAALGARAAPDQGYYVRRLFGHYGANGTLPSEGLARLLLSLGLGRVRVVRIEHGDGDGDGDALGHGHAAHLDLLDVQERGHRHRHPAAEHRAGRGTATGTAATAPGTATGTAATAPGTAATAPPLLPPPRRTWGRAGRGAGGGAGCLNVSQLLLSLGLAPVARLTPEQFSLLCPALLYQIDSRVCILHRDELPPAPAPTLWPALGWALLAVALLSLPSALAVGLAPLLRGGSFGALLPFLVALAAGTLCGDALLHLWPHAQGEPAAAARALRQGLAVLGGIYVLFLLELLLGVLRRRRREATRPGTAGGRPQGETPRAAAPVQGAELRCLTAPELEPPGVAEPHEQPHGHPHGHAHGPALPPGPGTADLVWMVVLGDGIHNLMDGVAIGAAFSRSAAGGLSTALAVLCHELPHELGDLALLLRAGAKPRALLLLSLLSALLAGAGAAAGAAAGQGAAHGAPALLAAAAGLFLYVALADMLPEVLRGAAAAGGGSWGRFALHNGGFVLGAGATLGIALLEGRFRERRFPLRYSLQEGERFPPGREGALGFGFGKREAGGEAPEGQP
ncbi:zinc transporter ZIP5 [Eudromia elegans]